MMTALLWVLAFLVPAFALGAPLPHAPYVLIPVLAMSTGLTDRYAFRRVIIWSGLVLFYELVYHVPAGMLAAPVVAMSLLHVASARFIQVNDTSVRERTSPVAVTRFAAGLFAWSTGLIVLSVLWGTLFYGFDGLSFNALRTVWWEQGAAARMLVGILVTLLIVHAERIRRVRTYFSDDAVIQTYNLSD